MAPGDRVGIVRDLESHRATVLLNDFDEAEVDLVLEVKEIGGGSVGINLPPEVEIVLGLSPEDTGAPLDVQRESPAEISVATIS